MLMVQSIQSSILLLATLLLFALQAWALIDAISHRPEAYEAGNKQTKTMWLVILGVTFVAHLIFWDPINLLNLVGAVAAIVYLVDVRPVLRSLTRR